jgi:hypothetical protein
MSDNPMIAVAVVDPHPAGETLPVPTPEQERASDQLFAPSEEHHAAVHLLGMVASVHFLHDLAIETFKKGEKEEAESGEDRLKVTGDRDEADQL